MPGRCRQYLIFPEAGDVGSAFARLTFSGWFYTRDSVQKADQAGGAMGESTRRWSTKRCNLSTGKKSDVAMSVVMP